MTSISSTQETQKNKINEKNNFIFYGSSECTSV